jgi:hypothetical protein
VFRFLNPITEDCVRVLVEAAGESLGFLDQDQRESGFNYLWFTLASYVLDSLSLRGQGFPYEMASFIEANEDLCLDAYAIRVIGRMRSSLVALSDSDVNEAVEKTRMAAEVLWAYSEREESGEDNEEAKEQARQKLHERVWGLCKMFRRDDVGFDADLVNNMIAALEELSSELALEDLCQFLAILIPRLAVMSVEAFEHFARNILEHFGKLDDLDRTTYMRDLVDVFVPLFSTGFDAVPDEIRSWLLNQFIGLLVGTTIGITDVQDMLPCVTFVCRLTLSLGPAQRESLVPVLEAMPEPGDSIPAWFALAELMFSRIALGAEPTPGIEQWIERIQPLAVFDYQRQLGILALRTLVETHPQAQGELAEMINRLAISAVPEPQVLREVMADPEGYECYLEQPYPWDTEEIPGFQEIDLLDEADIEEGE